MNSYRNYAIAAGILFIIADLVGFMSLPFIAPVNDTNYLVSVSTNANLVTTAALLLFIGGAAAIGIGISLYPVLKKFKEGLALGAVGFRIAEGMLDFVAVISLLVPSDIKPAICKRWSAGFIVFPNLRRIGRWRIPLDIQYREVDDLFHRRNAILYHILSNKNSSSMVIRLGYCCCNIHHVISPLNHVRSHRSILDSASHFESSNIAPRIGSCGMADSQRIQSISN